LINVLLYIPLDIIAVFTFKKNLNKNTNELDVKAMNFKNWIVTIVLFLIGSLATFGILYIIPGQVYPLLNALSISFFLTAIFIRNLRFKEFWWFNLIGNVITVAMWAFVSTSATDQLYTLPFVLSSIAAILNNIYGIIVWKSIYKKAITNGGIYVKKTIKINKVIKIRRKYMQSLKWNKEIEEKHKRIKEGK